MLRRSRRLSTLACCLTVAACGASSAKDDARRDGSTSGREVAPTVDDAASALDARIADAQTVADTRRDEAGAQPDAKTDAARGDDGTPDDSDMASPSDTPVADAAPSSDLGIVGDGQSAPDGQTASDAAPADAPKPITLAAWPGGNAVVNASVKNGFGTNLSGLTYQPAAGTAPAILWAVQNAPSKVYQLTWNGTAFVSVTTDGWKNGKTLVYPNGSGSPDSEALTRTEWDKSELYVAAEENNDDPSTSRLSILRYDLSGTSTSLRATHEWNVTADLPKASDPNKGLEAIAWIPDSYLVARGFFDEATKATYDPSVYADHGTGIFLVGVEDTGMVYGFAVNHSTGAYKRVASFSSGQAGVMDLAFDRDTYTLWALCDSLCDDRMTLLDIDTTLGSPSKGRFVLRATVPPPKTLTSTNNEGITMAPQSECVDNRKGFFWADDDESNGYAIRRDTIPCDRVAQSVRREVVFGATAMLQSGSRHE